MKLSSPIEETQMALCGERVQMQLFELWNRAYVMWIVESTEWALMFCLQNGTDKAVKGMKDCVQRSAPHAERCTPREAHPGDSAAERWS